MNDFSIYFSLGWDHIMTPEALDHLLFIAVLTSIYDLGAWRKMLILITAFTIGHSISLAIATYKIFIPDTVWIEFLIPLTIVITAIFQLLRMLEKTTRLHLSYWMAVTFGLIHGLGFAGAIRNMLSSKETIAWPLFSFNIGIEAAQISVVIALTLLSIALQNVGLKKKGWVIAINSTALIIAGYICITRWPF